MKLVEKINKIPFGKLIWLIPTIYLFHELEEWFIFDWWAISFPDSSPLHKTGGRLWLIGTSILVFFLVAVLYRLDDIKKTAIGVLFVATLPFANGLQHIFWTFYFQSWAPGVVFAGFIGIPVGIYIAWRAVSERLVKPWFVFLLLLFSIFILYETIKAGNQVPDSMNLISDFVNWYAIDIWE